MFALTKEELNAMAEVDVRTVEINTLTDIRDVKIDTRVPMEKKIEIFSKQSKNLYVHRVGDYIIKVKFQKEGSTIDDRMEEYIRHLAEIHI